MELQNPVVISQSKESEADASPIKVVVLGAITVLSSVASAWFVSGLLAAYTTSGAWLAFGSAVLLAVFVVLHAFFVKSAWVRGLMLTVAGLVPAVMWSDFVYPVPSYVFVGGLVLFAGFLVGAAGEGARKLSNSVHVHFFDTARGVIVKLITGLLILVGAFSYAYFVERGNLTDGVGKGIVRGVLGTASPILSAKVPNVSLSTQTAGELFAVLASSAFETLKQQSISKEYPSGVRGDFSQISPKEKAQIIADTTVKIRTSFEERVGPINDRDKISDIVYRAVKKFLLSLDPTTRSGVAIATLFSILAAFKGVSFIAIWIVQFVSFLVFKFLVATGFARVASETRVREFVILP